MRHAPARLLLALTLLACRSTPATQPTPTPTDASVAREASAPTEAPPAPAAPAPHGEPVVVPARAGAVALRVEFFGGPAQALGASVRLAADGGARSVAIEDWPSGVRVRAGAVGPSGSVFVLVETVAALDRPAGLRSLIELRGGTNTEGTWTAESAPLALQRAAQTIQDAAALERALSAQAPQPDAERCGALIQLLRSAEGLARMTDDAGLDVFVRWSDGLVTRRETVAAQDARAPARAAALWQSLELVPETFCAYGFGEFSGEGRATRLRSVRVSATAPAPSPTTPPATPPATPVVVPALADRAAVVRYLRMRFPGESEVIAAAPLTAQGGVIALARVAASSSNVVVTQEGELWRTMPLGRAVNINSDTVLGARFLDANGDGRTDAVIESGEAPSRMGSRQLYLAPAASMASSLTEDEASILALRAAPSLDAAVATLGSVPWRGLTAREACPAVTASRTTAGLRRVATADFRFLMYEEPGTFAWNPTLAALDEPDASVHNGGAMPCGELRCSAARPICTWVAHGEPGGGAYFFRWEAGQLKLSGIAMYSGS